MGSSRGLVRQPEVGERDAQVSPLQVIPLVDVLPVDNVKSHRVGSVITPGTVSCANSFGTRQCWQRLAGSTKFTVGDLIAPLVPAR